MAYAIIKSGGRQVRVEPGAVVDVDHRDDDVGASVTFDDVLFISQEPGGFVAGSPHVQGARVHGVVEGERLGKKVRVFTKRRRKGTRRTLGHRTKLTRVRITEIET